MRDEYRNQLQAAGCGCGRSIETAITYVIGFPNTLVIHLQPPCDITYSIEVTKLVQKAYYYTVKVVYELASIVLKLNDSVIMFKREMGKLYKMQTKVSFIQVEERYLKVIMLSRGVSEVCLFYDKSLHKEKNTLKADDDTWPYNCLELDSEALPFLGKFSIGGVRITSEDVQQMLSKDWYSSGHIDKYMKCLSENVRMHQRKILFVASHWVANSFFL